LNHQTERLSNENQATGIVTENEKQVRDGVIEISFIQKPLNSFVNKGRQH